VIVMADAAGMDPDQDASLPAGLTRRQYWRVDTEIRVMWMTAGDLWLRWRDAVSPVRGEDIDLPLRRGAIAWSDSTGNTAARIASDRTLQDRRRWFRAIHDAILRRTERQGAIIRDYYWRQRPTGAILREHNISRATLTRIQRALVADVARAMLPWLGPDEADRA
jgi:hypothetical protein